MASLTVRNLSDVVVRGLKMRAASHGRSMEEEVRHLLGAGAVEQPGTQVTSESAPCRDVAAPVPVADPAGSAGEAQRRVLLVIGGGIAAYKSLDLIRRLRERGFAVRVVMTNGAQEFVTPLAAGAIAGERAHTDLFDAGTEFDVGHIRLARDTSIVVVAPATANLIAKMAAGIADDLASTVLLATHRPILIAPAMNPVMWGQAATRRNIARLLDDGVTLVGPNAGEMAERGEAGVGRMAEPLEIVAAVENSLARADHRPLAGRRVLVTSGPTHEPIDPVRFIANRSSGKQGHAIAAAAARA